MRTALPAPLRKGALFRYPLLAACSVALFRFGLGQSWTQALVVTTILLFAEVTDLSRALGDVDPRHARAALGAVLLGVGALAAVRAEPVVAGTGFAVGGWIVLDAAYSLRSGVRPTADDDDLGGREVMLSVQLSSLLADELKDGPKTVPELAAACDMTESRVRDTLDLMTRSDTVYRDGETWVLDESKVGPWAFVRDNTRRVVARLVRPFRLFLPA